MRTWILTALLATAIFSHLWTFLSSQTVGFSSPVPTRGREGTELQVVSALLPNGGQQIVVLDANQKSLSVYHVSPQDGKVQLRSVRNIAWDLSMEEFNGTAPLPSELRQIRP